MQRTHL
jgi:hypothetical protein